MSTRWQIGLVPLLASLLVAASSIVIVAGATCAMAADDPSAHPENKKPKPAPPPMEMPAAAPIDQKERVEFFTSRLKDLRIRRLDELPRPISFIETPLYRFNNPTTRISDGFMFLWTDRGRPAAAMKSYYNWPPRTWGRTVVTLAQQAIVLESGEQKLWAPPQAAFPFAPLKVAPRPADRPGLRLAQMRKLAERFQVVDNWGIKDPSDWQLRLLTTPLYRYEVPEENVVDGALFGYVLTSSPEALVLLEARNEGGGLTWHYMVSRFTRFGITFSLDERKIAEFPRLDEWPLTGTYFHHPVSMPDYPFKDDRKAAAQSE
jgi:hypothetical protein